jgi:hypothetical protein
VFYFFPDCNRGFGVLGQCWLERAPSPASSFDLPYLTYSTTEPVKPPNWSKYAKTTTIFFALLCLSHKTHYRSNTKGDFRLPYRPIVLAISEVTRLLLEHLTLNNNDYLNALEESLFALKLCLTALSLHVLKSKPLSNISLTLIREDLRPSCARCQIWQIKC